MPRNAITPPASTKPHEPSTRLRYLPGLDGLRALAVAAVLLYHSSLGWLPGGYLGVEIFFVISGYLICLLLLAEWRARGSISLEHFWLRRARRLLPALFVVIAAALAFTVLFLPDEVASLRSDAVAALTYSTNWYLIFAGKSYFQTVGRPSLLLHLWSLAVEEQFYLLFPPLLLFLLTRWKPRRVFFTLLLGAAASTASMVFLYQPDADPSRLYYGTDTRASGLLIGAALAFVWTPWERVGSRRVGWLLDAVGVGALAGLAIACVRLDEFEPFLYQGGLLAVSLTTAALIAAAVHPQARVVPGILGWRPLVWIGQRSYSLYLWHWLVFDLTRPQLDIPLTGVALLALQVVISLVLAEASHRWVESPIRGGALGRAWSNLRQSRGTRRLQLSLRWASGVTALTLFSVLLGESVASAQVSPQPYLAALPVTGTPLPIPSQVAPTLSAPTPTATSVPVAPSPESPSSTPVESPLAAPSITHLTPTAQPRPNSSRTAIGDSVMLGASPELKRALGSVQVDAAVGRQVLQAITILQGLRAAGRLGQVVIIHLGNNGPFSSRQFDALMSILTGVPRVVFVNDKVPRQWESQNNAVLAEGAKRYPNVVVVDWHAASADHPEYFWNDGIHLRPAGAQVYAGLIAAAINGP